MMKKIVGTPDGKVKTTVFMIINIKIINILLCLKIKYYLSIIVNKIEYVLIISLISMKLNFMKVKL